MVFPKARLIVSACLFVGWLGFLAWLVAQTRQPVVLSRPQFLVADLFVVANVQTCQGWPCPEVIVLEGIWPADSKELVGKPLTIVSLGDCGVDHGWTGANQYILALSRPMEGKTEIVEVTPLPSTPNYFSKFATVSLFHPGPNPDKVANLLTAHLTGLTPDQSLALVKSAPTLVKRNVPLKEALLLDKAAKAAGADLRLREVETRIYQATPEARRQLADILAER